MPSDALVRASGGRPDVAASALSMLHLGDVAEPELAARDWVRVMPTLSGICGSDLAAIGGHASLYLHPPPSHPFLPGHPGGGTLGHGAPVCLPPAPPSPVPRVQPPPPPVPRRRPPPFST